MSMDEPTRRVLPIREPTPMPARALDVRDLPAPRPLFERPSAPAGAPNVVVVLLDDMGFGASSAFGGPCEMPVADRLAEQGLRYTRFHTTAICSATRAALLTGRNHHSVGFGHIPEFANGWPGYSGRRPRSAATMPQVLQYNGYATGAFGKMHEVAKAELTPVGPFDGWPTGQGFERFYGFIGGGEMDHWHPTLYDGTVPVDPPRTPEEGYHLSEDLVDRAIQWLRDVRMLTPTKPFLCYLPMGATHAPLHVAPEWVAKYRGRFDGGWDRQRELTLARQKELGVVPGETELAPWAPGVPHWDDLDEVERRVACAFMELYAGFAEHADAQVGRLVDELAVQGVLDNTVILYVLGDNGASAEGGMAGAFNEWSLINGLPETAAYMAERLDQLGGPHSSPNLPVGWALAMDTPYAWLKWMASHYGGTRNGLIVHWPNGISEPGGLRHQWHHVIDIAPTIYDLAGIPEPDSVDGVPQMPIAGTSMTYSFEDPDAPERHVTQYFEISGNRAIYHDGWVACTAHDHRPWVPAGTPDISLREDVWELYDTRSDWSQARDVAGENPDKLRELQQLFLIEATRHGVLPIDDRGSRLGASGLPLTSMRFHGQARGLPMDRIPNVIGVSHVVAAEITVPDGGAEGVICAQGGRFGGWSLYCHEGVLVYCHNVVNQRRHRVRTEAPLEPGTHEVRYTFETEGGRGAGGIGRLYVDGVEAATGHIADTVPVIFQVSEDFNVGVDRGTPVSDDYRPLRNAFTGAIAWVDITVEPTPEVSDQRREGQMAAQ